MQSIEEMIEGLKNLTKTTETLEQVNKAALKGLEFSMDNADTKEKQAIVSDITQTTQKILMLAKTGDIAGITKLHEGLLKKYGNNEQKTHE